MATARFSILVLCQKLGGQKKTAQPFPTHRHLDRDEEFYIPLRSKHTWNIPRISPRFNYGYTTTLYSKKTRTVRAPS